MPVLKEYSESYEKDGYYVHAPIDGLSHPLPLQTPDISARIYHELGYQPGDHIPNELTWKLYGVGLHWTESTGADHLSPDELRSAIYGESGPDFTDEQAQTILSIVESYSGEYETELQELIEELDSDGRLKKNTEGDSEPDVVANLDELLGKSEKPSGIAHFREAVPRSLTDDEIELVEDIATPDEIDTINGVTFGASEITSEAEYFQRLGQCENIVTSFEEIPPALPLDLWRVVPTPPSIGYSFDTDANVPNQKRYQELRHFVVSDYRWDDDYGEDLRITIAKSGVSVRFQIRDEHISNFTVITPDQELGHLDEKAIGEGVADEEMTSEQLMHHGLGTVVAAAELLEEFFDEVPSYRLCPVEPFAPV